MFDLHLLEKLVDTPGVSGREHFIRNVIRQAVEECSFFDQISEDALGNLICTRFGKAAKSRKILLAAHMDQPGFLVSAINDCGTLALHPVGTYDVRTLASQRVVVVTDYGQRLMGTIHISGAPIHTASSEDTTKNLVLKDFHVDLGMSETGIRDTVKPGDMVVWVSPLEIVGDYVVAAGLDNRIGCWAAIKSLSHISNSDDDLIFAFTVQEELGSRGAGPVAYATQPDIALICETVVSSSVPTVPKNQHICSPGCGIALQIADSSMISDRSLIRIAEDAAAEAGIKLQRSLMLGGGQDGAIIQRNRAGVSTLALGCPLKFMHASREYANMTDVKSYPQLIATIVNNL